MKRTLLAALAALAVAAVAVAAPAHVAPNVGTLTPARTLLTWSGTFGGEHVLTPAPDARCLEDVCHEYLVRVALGDGYWDANGAGAVEFSIRWVYDGVKDLDLVVYGPDGAEAGRSEAVDSNAESLFVRDAVDGLYTVRVIPTNTVNPDEEETSPLPYEALAQVEILAADAPGEGRALIPNLVSKPPSEFHVATAANLIPFPENPAVSCYPEETLESERHPVRCLRFNQTIANTGDGPLELRFEMSGAASPDEADQRMLQRVHWSDGTFEDRFADSYELHAAHAHVHYTGFGQSFLFPVDAETHERTGDGTPASIGSKVGFCVIDVELLDEYWGAPGNGPRNHTFPTCNVPQELDDEGLWMIQGIDVGWADVYGWNLADQYIDISDVPNGTYELVQVANPNGSVLEQTLGDNCASTVIRIEGEYFAPTVTPLASRESVACP